MKEIKIKNKEGVVVINRIHSDKGVLRESSTPSYNHYTSLQNQLSFQGKEIFVRRFLSSVVMTKIEEQ